jgi:hypothetical protein
MAVYGIATIGGAGPAVLKALGTLAATLTATLLGRRHLMTAWREPTAANVLGGLLTACWLCATLAQPYVAHAQRPIVLWAFAALLVVTLSCLPLGIYVSTLGTRAGRGTTKRKKNT